jgi:hypothetical protein
MTHDEIEFLLLQYVEPAPSGVEESRRRTRTASGATRLSELKKKLGK